MNKSSRPRLLVVGSTSLCPCVGAGYPLGMALHFGCSQLGCPCSSSLHGQGSAPQAAPSRFGEPKERAGWGPNSRDQRQVSLLPPPLRLCLSKSSWTSPG